MKNKETKTKNRKVTPYTRIKMYNRRRKETLVYNLMERFKAIENKNRNLKAKLTYTEQDNVKLKNDLIKMTRKQKACVKVNSNNVNQIKVQEEEM